MLTENITNISTKQLLKYSVLCNNFLQGNSTAEIILFWKKLDTVAKQTKIVWYMTTFNLKFSLTHLSI